MKNSSILLLVVLGSSILLASCGTKPATDGTTPTAPVVSDEVIVPQDTTNLAPTTTLGGTAAGEQTNLAPSDTPRGIAEGGLYLPYTPTALAQASDDIVLFFYASWSPASITTHKDIIAKKATLPKDLTLLQVNFDDSDAMKQQYGVTEQNTFVQVTNTGELIKKWRGANSLEDIVKQIQK